MKAHLLKIAFMYDHFSEMRKSWPCSEKKIINFKENLFGFTLFTFKIWNLMHSMHSDQKIQKIELFLFLHATIIVDEDNWQFFFNVFRIWLGVYSFYMYIEMTFVFFFWAMSFRRCSFKIFHYWRTINNRHISVFETSYVRQYPSCTKKCFHKTSKTLLNPHVQEID